MRRSWKNSWKSNLSKLALLVLCLVLCATWAFAAGTGGSISVYLTDANDLPVGGVSIALHRVAEPDGSLAAQFAGAGVDPASLASGLDNAKNAKTLADYAAAHGIAGTVKTTDSAGVVKLEGLTDGIYMVVCRAGQVVTFTPYLVHLPTVINGAADYDVESYPKAEDADVPTPGPGPSIDPEPTVSPEPTDFPEPTDTPEPTDSPEPTDPPDPDEPDLPQTGVNVWPVYLLLGVGSLFVVVGLIDLCVTRRKRDE